MTGVPNKPMTGVPIKPTLYLVPEPERARFGFGEGAREGDKPLVSSQDGQRGMGGGIDPLGWLRKGLFDGFNKYIDSGEYSRLPQYNQSTGKYEGDFGFTFQKNLFGVKEQDIFNALASKEQDNLKKSNKALYDKARNLQAKSGFDEDSSPLKTTKLTARFLPGKVEGEEKRQAVRDLVEDKYLQEGAELPEGFKTQSRKYLTADLANKKRVVEAFEDASDEGVILTPEQRAQAFKTGKTGSIMRAIKDKGFDDELKAAREGGKLKNDLMRSSPEFQRLVKNDANRLEQEKFNNNRLLQQDAIANQISLGNLDLQTTKLGLEAQQAQNNYNLQMRQYEADVDYRNRRMEYDRARLGQERMDNIFKLLLGGINTF